MSYLTYNDFYSGSKDQNKKTMKYGDICYATLYNTVTGKEVGTLDAQSEETINGSIYYWLTSGCKDDEVYKKIQIQLIPGSANDTPDEIGPWSKRMGDVVQTTEFFFMNVGLKDIINEIPLSPTDNKRNYTDYFVLNDTYPWICTPKYDQGSCTGFKNWSNGKIQLHDTKNGSDTDIFGVEYDKYYNIRHNDNKGRKYDWRMSDNCKDFDHGNKYPLLIKFTKISGPINQENIDELNIGRTLCNKCANYDKLVKHNFLLKGGIGKDYTKEFVSKKLQVPNKKKYYQITTEAVPSYTNVRQAEQNDPNSNSGVDPPKKCGIPGSQTVRLGSIIYDNYVDVKPAFKHSIHTMIYHNAHIDNKFIHGKLSKFTDRITCPNLPMIKESADYNSWNPDFFNINICGDIDFDATLPWSTISVYSPLKVPFKGNNGMIKSITFTPPPPNPTVMNQGTLTLDLLLTDMEECKDLIIYFNDNHQYLDNNVMKACILGCLSTNVGNNYTELLYGKITNNVHKISNIFQGMFNASIAVEPDGGEKTINNSFMDVLDDQELKDDDNLSVSIFFKQKYTNFFKYLHDVIRPIYFNDYGTEVYILDPSFYNKKWDGTNIQDLVRMLCRDTEYKVELTDNYQNVTLENFNKDPKNKDSKNILYSGWDLLHNKTYIKSNIDNGIGTNVSLARYIKIEIESWSLGLYAFYMRMKGIKPPVKIDEKLFEHTNYSTYNLFKNIEKKAEQKGSDDTYQSKADFSEQINEVCGKENPGDISEFPDNYSSFLFGDNDLGQPVILAEKNRGKYDKNLGLCQCANSQFKADAPHALNELLQTYCFSQGCDRLSDVYDDKTCGKPETCDFINNLFTNSECVKRTYVYDDFNKVKYDRLCGKEFPIVFKKKNQRTIELVTIILCVSLSLFILLLVKGNWIAKGVIAGGTVTILVLISKLIIRSIKTDDCGNPINPAQ